MLIVPNNWSELQHYKDRSPPWIKLHKKLLDNFEFQSLPVASRALAPMLWLLASEHEQGLIDATPEKLAFRLRMTVDDAKDALRPLIHNGFFSVVQGDSSVLANPERDARPETEAERETKEEGEKKPRRAARTPSIPQPSDVAEQVWIDWVALRMKRRTTVSATAVDGARAEAATAGLTLEEFLRLWCVLGWQGLTADRIKPEHRRTVDTWRTEQRQRTQQAAPGVAAYQEPAADFFAGQTIEAPARRLN